MQNSWLSSKADEIQPFADRKDTKKFYEALKTVMVQKALDSSHFLVQMDTFDR